MTKIFAVYANVILIKKPDWLDDFREKYDEKYDFHITLKQPSFIKTEQVTDVKNKLSSVLAECISSNHQITVTFDKIAIDEQVIDGIYIMINAKNNEPLNNLQKNIRTALKGYDNFCEEKSRAYEKIFVPHITIARHLNDKKYKRAKRYLLGDYICEGVIKNIYLSVVKEDNVREAINPNNITSYNL